MKKKVYCGNWIKCVCGDVATKLKPQPKLPPETPQNIDVFYCGKCGQNYGIEKGELKCSK